MEKSDQINELATALSKAQASFGTVVRDKTVKVKTTKGYEYTFKYAPLETIMAAVVKPLAENGLAFVQSLQEDGKSVETYLLHSSGQFIRSKTPLVVTDSGAQALGSAITYARRYGATLLLGVVSDDDDDGNAAAGNSATQQSPARQQQQRPTQQQTAPVPFLDQLEAALADRGMADSRCLNGLKAALDEKAKAKGSTFDFDNVKPQTAAAVLKQIAAGKFDYLKEPANV